MSNGKTTNIEVRRLSLEGLAISQKQFTGLRERIVRLIPWTFIKKGSALWWEKSEMESRRAYRSKKYITLETGKKIDRFLRSL